MDDQPFRGRQAVRDGVLTNYRLRARYRAIYRDVYVPEGLMVTAAVRARAAWLWAGGDCVLSGVSAAAVLGTKWLDGNLPAEFIRSDRHSPPDILVRSYVLAPEDVCVVRGMRVTTPVRTAFDIGRTRPQNRAIPLLDALMAATGVKPAEVRNHHRKAGCASCWSELACQRLRRRSNSMTTTVTHSSGVDMGWREWMVAVEYDGIQHWSDRRQRSWDIERVRAKLRWAGCPI